MKFIKYLVLVLFLNGCVVAPVVSNYKMGNIGLSQQTNLSVKVLPFKDHRQKESYSHSFGCFMLTMIPLWPYCTKYYNADAGQSNFIRFMETMRIALTKDLKQNNLFSKVYMDEDKKTDIYIQASVEEYSLSKKSSNWGLSLVGVYLGLYGIPMGWARNDASITYTVMDKRGNKLFEKNYTHHETRVHGMYYPSIVALGISFKPINNQFFRDLAETLGEKGFKIDSNINNFEFNNSSDHFDIDYSEYE